MRSLAASWVMVVVAFRFTAGLELGEVAAKFSPTISPSESVTFCKDKPYGGYFDPDDRGCYISCYGPTYEDPLGLSNNGHRSCCEGNLCHTLPTSNSPFGSCEPCSGRGSGGGSSASPGEGPTSPAPPAAWEIAGPPALKIHVPPRLSPAGAKPVCRDQSLDLCQVSVQSWTYKAGVGKNVGGSVTYISNPWSSQNVINVHDTGRLLQQSYYGDWDGSMIGNQAWPWNPVQGGDITGATGEVLKMSRVSTTEVRSTSVPRNWAGGQLLTDVLMETLVVAKLDHVLINMKMHYNGTKNQASKDQELPAVFLPRRFDKLWFYDGPAPWSGEPVKWVYPHTFYDIKDAALTLVTPTEGWVAYQDSATGEAVGFLSPSAVAAIAYRVGFENVGGPDDFNCSYVSPIGRFGINAGASVSYNVYVALGSIGDIRNVFQKIIKDLTRG
eukprot:jgi/Botrbrau1/6279/Bobra.0129s0024.1